MRPRMGGGGRGTSFETLTLVAICLSEARSSVCVVVTFKRQLCWSRLAGQCRILELLSSDTFLPLIQKLHSTEISLFTVPHCWLHWWLLYWEELNPCSLHTARASVSQLKPEPLQAAFFLHRTQENTRWSRKLKPTPMFQKGLSWSKRKRFGNVRRCKYWQLCPVTRPPDH